MPETFLNRFISHSLQHFWNKWEKISALIFLSPLMIWERRRFFELIPSIFLHYVRDDLSFLWKLRLYVIKKKKKDIQSLSPSILLLMTFLNKIVFIMVLASRCSHITPTPSPLLSKVSNLFRTNVIKKKKDRQSFHFQFYL